MQLKVTKVDGSVEEYLHTKVIGTVSNALSEVDQANVSVAEQLADVVTHFLYNKQKRRIVTSGEILSIIKAVLTSSGYEDAAVALSEHHMERKLKRCRIEVIPLNVQELADAELLCKPEQLGEKVRWNKSQIVADLVASFNISHQTARTIASIVEQKIFNMDITLVPTSLIRQLVLADAAAVLLAQQQLRAI